jgi:hypothetical protein
VNLVYFGQTRRFNLSASTLEGGTSKGQMSELSMRDFFWFPTNTEGSVYHIQTAEDLGATVRATVS